MPENTGQGSGLPSGVPPPPLVPRTTAGNNLPGWVLAWISLTFHRPRSSVVKTFCVESVPACIPGVWGNQGTQNSCSEQVLGSLMLLELFASLPTGPTVNRKVQTHAGLAAN